MFKTTIFFLLIFCGTYAPLQAQNININEEPTITRMMSRMVEINRIEEYVEGWRIQIMATTDRQKMEETRREFLRNYPQVSLDWIHEKPYYKLRAGAFLKKLDAMNLLHRLKRYYPSAYPAKDHQISPQELVGL